MTTVIDCADARVGEAKRLLNELELHLSGQARQDLRATAAWSGTPQ